VRLNPDTSAVVSHPRQQELLDHLASHGGARLLRDLVQVAGFGRSLIGTMERRGLLLLADPPTRTARNRERFLALVAGGGSGGWNGGHKHTALHRTRWQTSSDQHNNGCKQNHNSTSL
jgi:hypothetical protein